MATPPPALDFVGKRGWFYLISFLIILPGVISLLIPPSLKPGIDFSSGSTFTVQFKEGVSKDELKAAMDDLGHSEARVQGTGNNEYLVRTRVLEGASSGPAVGPTRPGERDVIEDALIERFGPMVDTEGKEVNRFIAFSSVSASVSKDIARSAALAIIAASAAIFLYLWWSFRAVPRAFRFGAAAIIALLHDALLVVGVFSILGKAFDTEINVLFITALLTVIGFSVHDSIVVFDRIRETLARGEGRSYAEAVNNSILQTLARSINTSLTLVFSILALMLMGGESIREFLWAMLVGTITGAYSSVFVASMILVSWEEGDVPRVFRRMFGRPERAAEAETSVEPAAS